VNFFGTQEMYGHKKTPDFSGVLGEKNYFFFFPPFFLGAAFFLAAFFFVAMVFGF
jgi:hypothetical protein